MQKFRISLVAVLVAAAAAFAYAQAPEKSAPKPAAHPAAHAAPMLNASDMKWGAAPPAFNAGAQMAVVDGDPSQPGPFVIRAKFPAGFKVMPNWHPTDESVTVI